MCEPENKYEFKHENKDENKSEIELLFVSLMKDYFENVCPGEVSEALELLKDTKLHNRLFGRYCRYYESIPNICKHCDVDFTELFLGAIEWDNFDNVKAVLREYKKHLRKNNLDVTLELKSFLKEGLDIAKKKLEKDSKTIKFLVEELAVL